MNFERLPKNETADGMERVLDVIKRLRDKDGCPWDREQTIETLKPCLVEETYELIDAIDSGDLSRHREELGDVLLQVALQAQIRKEEGAFGFDDVAATLCEKLVRRHPHVFGRADVSGTRDVLRNWESIKAEEQKDRKTPRRMLDGIPRHLPALQKAQRVQSRASRVGFDWSRTDEVLEKVQEEIAELKEALSSGDATRVDEEIGDLLFAVVNLSRFCGSDAEQTLTRATSKFVQRFHDVQRRAEKQGNPLWDCSPAEMDTLWETVKNEERSLSRAPGESDRRE